MLISTCLLFLLTHRQCKSQSRCAATMQRARNADTISCMQRLDESELKLYVKQLQKQFVISTKVGAAHEEQVCVSQTSQLASTFQDV